MIKLKIKNLGEIEIELSRDEAPESAANFTELARSGFYDGLTFHRVISGFMIQGGDPEGTGCGGPGYSICGEFSANGVANSLKHKRGALSMARSSEPNSAGSQFFIVHKDSTFLDGNYAVFGHVVKGIEVVDEIAKSRTNASDKPLIPVVIESISVENEPIVEFKKL